MTVPDVIDMTKRPDYYRLLHVQADAPDAVIRASHRTLMQAMRMHPDLGGDHAQAVVLNEALATLTDPVKRAAYDRDLCSQDAWTSEDLHTTEPQRAATGSSTTNPQGHACRFCAAPASAAAIEQPDGQCHACASALNPAHRDDAGSQTRRGLERLPRNMRLTFRRATAPDETLTATTEDVSINGMRFVTPVSVQVGDCLRVDCDFCSAVTIVRSVLAKTTGSGPRYRVGVEFVTLRITMPRGAFVSSVA